MVELVSAETPANANLADFHAALVADGHHATMPVTGVVDGMGVTRFALTKGSPLFAAILPILPIAIIGGFITFGITRIESISRALVPISLIAIGGIVLFTALITRKSVVQAAAPAIERLASRR